MSDSLLHAAGKFSAHVKLRRVKTMPNGSDLGAGAMFFYHCLGSSPRHSAQCVVSGRSITHVLPDNRLPHHETELFANTASTINPYYLAIKGRASRQTHTHIVGQIWGYLEKR